MLEVALEDGVAWKNFTDMHRTIDSLGHLEHSVLIASVDNHVEQISVRQLNSFVFAFCNYLKQLIGSE